MQFLGHFLLVGILFAVVDSIWIGLIANKFYKKNLGHLLADKPSFVPAVIFYVIYIAAMVFFVVDPALEADATQANAVLFALGHGAFLGLFAYATYDLTNAATLKNWPKIVTIVDMLWGTVATATVCTVAFLILK